jgi:FMN phosphatase YigB (HAD superfamily)
MPPAVQNVIFDLGVVMLHLEYDRAIASARALCDPARKAGFTSFFGLLGRSPAVDAYERGEMSAEEFFERFRDASGFRGSFEDFVAIWRSIFAENRLMIDFAREVSGRYPVYYMTNASDLHVPWVFERYPSLDLHRDCACSCYLHAGKPERAFYERGLARFGIPAATALLIDDRPENIAGAAACGLPGLLYTTPEATIAAARRLIDLA